MESKTPVRTSDGRFRAAVASVLLASQAPLELAERAPERAGKRGYPLRAEEHDQYQGDDEKLPEPKFTDHFAVSRRSSRSLSPPFGRSVTNASGCGGSG